MDRSRTSHDSLSLEFDQVHRSPLNSFRCFTQALLTLQSKLVNVRGYSPENELEIHLQLEVCWGPCSLTRANLLHTAPRAQAVPPISSRYAHIHCRNMLLVTLIIPAIVLAHTSSIPGALP